MKKNYIEGWNHPEKIFKKYNYTVTDGLIESPEWLGGVGEVWARSYKTMEEARIGAQQRYEFLKLLAGRDGLVCTDVLVGTEPAKYDRYVLIRQECADGGLLDIYEHIWHEEPRGAKNGKN